MSGRFYLWIVCSMVLLCSLFASPAKAQFLSGGSYGLGFFNYGSPYVYQQRIPYYALYPPVYYSYPVARTYGYSPFAYPPGTLTPNLPPKVEAANYTNPFVTPKTERAAADRSVRTVPAPRGKAAPQSVAKTFVNPYVPQAIAANGPPRPSVE